MDDGTFDALAPQDRITFLVGKAAQLNVTLEHAVRLIWMGLMDDSRAKYALPRGPRDVLEAVEKIIPHIGLSQREVDACLATTKAISQAHNRRHRLVHEHWSYRSEESAWHPIPRDVNDIFNGKLKPGWTQTDFEESIQDLLIAGRRAAALSSLIGAVTQSDFRRSVEGDMSESPVRPVMVAIAEGDYSKAPVEFLAHLDEHFLDDLE
jgi:hypothetical protein